MSGTFPTDPAPESVSLVSDHQSTVNVSASGKRQSRTNAGHLWKSAWSWSIMPRAELSPIYAFANAQEGSYGSFQVVLPNYATPNGSGAGSPVSGAAAPGVNSVSTSGWSGVGDFLKAGDVFKFNNHSKVYMATADVNSGSTTLSFIPALITIVPTSTAIIVNDVEFTMYLDSDVISWKGSAPNLAKITVGMTESL